MGRQQAPESAEQATAPIDQTPVQWSWPFSVPDLERSLDTLGHRPKTYEQLLQYARELRDNGYPFIEVREVGVTDGGIPICVIVIPAIPEDAPTKLIWSLDHVDEYFSSGTIEAAIHFLATTPSARTETFVFYPSIDPDAAILGEDWVTARWPLPALFHFLHAYRQPPSRQIELQFGLGTWSPAAMAVFIDVLQIFAPDLCIGIHDILLDPMYAGFTQPLRWLSEMIVRASTESGLPVESPVTNGRVRLSSWVW